MKNELKMKESNIKRLEVEVNEINHLIEHKKNENAEVLSRVSNEHKDQKANWNQSRD